MIFHIALKTDWDNAIKNGVYLCNSIKEEGFIHASFIEEVLNSYRNYFKPEQNLILLHIDESKITAKLIVEIASNGKKYPHIYGNLNLDAIYMIDEIDENFAKKF